MKKKIGVLFPLSGRDLNFKKSMDDVPKDFYYGTDFIFKNYSKIFDLKFIDSRAYPKKIINYLYVLFDRFINRITKFKFSNSRIHIVKSEILKTDILISFTDSGSLSIGSQKFNQIKPILIGGFHGLSDSVEDVPIFLKKFYKKKIYDSLKNLDHIFFFGDADRENAIKMFNLPKIKTSIFRHSIDTIFWHPEIKKTDEHILSVGSDPRRDYETLVRSQRTFKVKILTRLNIKKFEHFENIEIIKGSFHNKVISHLELKNLYNSATVIVVPIKNVLQPSGYSVTMQALACGKPVIIPKFRGLWDKDSFIHLKNCIFYDPEDIEDLGEKINMIMNDKKLQKSIGENARKLAIKVFNLERTNKDLLNLINLHIKESNLIKN